MCHSSLLCAKEVIIIVLISLSHFLLLQQKFILSRALALFWEFLNTEEGPRYFEVAYNTAFPSSLAALYLTFLCAALFLCTRKTRLKMRSRAAGQAPSLIIAEEIATGNGRLHARET